MKHSILSILIAHFFAAIPASAQEVVSASPDITIDLGASVIAADEDVALDNQLGLVMLENLGANPDASDVIALGLDLNEDRLLAFETTTALAGGVVARPGDVVRYDGAAYSIELDASAANSNWAAADLDAVMVPEASAGLLLLFGGALLGGLARKRRRYDRTRSRSWQHSSPIGAPAVAIAVVSLALANPAFATDGVLEINQTCAVQTGCFSGDSAGFPVTISQSGSYRLSGDLTLPDLATDGIVVSASFVQIDLNGFSVVGPGTCNVQTCATGTGRGVVQVAGGQISVRNGFVRGVGLHGLELGSGQVEQVTVASVGGDGIVLASGIARANRISLVGRAGLRFGSDLVTYSDNWIGLTKLDEAAPSIEGGRDAGGNICFDGSCEPRGLRRFYLTTSNVQGGGADEPGVCAAGFHFASIFEILDVSNLRYDTTLGFTQDDSGAGPPSDAVGWIRTGRFASSSQGVGRDNCNAWTASGLETGSVAGLDFVWNGPADPMSPFTSFSRTCEEFAGVWCVEN